MSSRVTHCQNSATSAVSALPVLQVKPVLKSTNAMPPLVSMEEPVKTCSTTTRAIAPWDSKEQTVRAKTAAFQIRVKMAARVLTLKSVSTAFVSMVLQG